MISARRRLRRSEYSPLTRALLMDRCINTIVQVVDEEIRLQHSGHHILQAQCRQLELFERRAGLRQANECGWSVRCNVRSSSSTEASIITNNAGIWPCTTSPIRSAIVSSLKQILQVEPDMLDFSLLKIMFGSRTQHICIRRPRRITGRVDIAERSQRHLRKV